MSQALVGEAVKLVFDVRALDGSLYGSQIQGFATALYRRRTGNAYVSAAEAVTLTYYGGLYEAVFTPGADADGYTYFLTIADPADVAEITRRFHSGTWTVTSAARTASEDDAFCDLADVQAHVQRGPFTDVTVPSRDQVLLFMAWAADEIEAVMAAAGLDYTAPSGANPIPATGEIALTVSSLARQANALRGAYKVVMAQAIQTSKETPERAKQLDSDYDDIMSKLREYVERHAKRSGGRARTSYTTTPKKVSW